MKKLLVITLILIGLIGVFINLLRVPQMEFYINSLKVGLFTYKIAIESNNNPGNELFHLSPFDDYYYTRDKKDHFWSEAGFTQSNSIIQWQNKLNNYRHQKTNTLFWSFSNKDSNLINNYQLRFNNQQIEITRTYTNLNPKIYAVGQSIVLCKTCLVIDDQKDMFINSESYSREKLEFADKYNLTPIIITDKLFPDFVGKVIIVDQNLKPVFSLVRNPDDEMYYDDRWQLIEVKKRISNPADPIIQKIEVY